MGIGGVRCEARGRGEKVWDGGFGIGGVGLGWVEWERKAMGGEGRFWDGIGGNGLGQIRDERKERGGWRWEG